MPLGDVGDDDPPPHAGNSVPSVAPEATWQAPAQNPRRETRVFVSYITVILVRGLEPGGQYRDHSQTNRFSESAVPGGFPPITDSGEDG